MENFWDYSVWAGINLIAVLLLSLLLANVLKRKIPWLNASLIPTSVLGGAVLLVLAGLYKLVCGDVMFDTAFSAATAWPIWRSSPITRWPWALSPRP